LPRSIAVTLSVYGSGRPAAEVVTVPIFVIAPTPAPQTGARIAFEVLARDATRLHPLVGQEAHYYFDAMTHFRGELTSLRPSTNVYSGPDLTPGRPVLSGILTVVGEVAANQ
jgi:hypothetical protein